MVYIVRVLNYAGSKWTMAKWIIREMPLHKVYLEPFFGSGAVLFGKESAVIEIINDIDSNVANLFKTMRDSSVDLAKVINLTPYAREEYLQSYGGLQMDVSEIERARSFLVRCWMAQNGKTATKTGWRNSDRAVKEWIQLPRTIVSAAERLKSVQINNMDALELIKNHNHEDCLIYADPPYLRSTKSQGMYAYEMSKQQHINFLEIITQHKGPAIVSGYESELYNTYLYGWRKIYFRDKEVLWLNFG